MSAAPRVQTLAELLATLDAFAAGDLTDARLTSALDAALAADPLGVERSDSEQWDAAPDDARLFWRLIHLFEHATASRDERRRIASRIVRCRALIDSAETHELLPLLVDQERFCAIARRHLSGVISRTGFLSVIAESGYAPHLKLWLEHAPPDSLARLCAQLDALAYDIVSAAIEHRP